VIPSREITSTTSGSTRLIWKVWEKFFVDDCMILLVENRMILLTPALTLSTIAHFS
jgi:hypothetical protein